MSRFHSFAKPLVILACIFVLGTFSSYVLELTSTDTSQFPEAIRTHTKIVRVVDGDTLKVQYQGKTERVRLIGINTPESVDPQRAVECFGKEAAEKTKYLVEGKDVLLISDPSQGDRDPHERLLRYVVLADGRFLNQVLIEEGFAFEYTYNQPYIHQNEFRNAERYAQDHKKGLWAKDVCGR